MAEASDGGPGRRSSGVRVALLAVAAVLLLAGGFALGRVTDEEDSGDDAPVAASTTETPGSDRGDDFVPIHENSNYDAEDVTSVFPPTIVNNDAIDAEPKGSASRALLEWWQAYQFGDFAAVEKLTSPETLKAVDPDKLQQLVELTGPGLQGIEVLNSSESGDTAAVNAGLLQFAPEKPGGPIPNKPSSSTPETFAMEKSGDEWLFAATEFLVLRLNSLPDE